MLVKFPMHNYALLLFIALAFVGTGLPKSLSADPVFNPEDQEIDEINETKSTNYSYTEDSILKSAHSRELSSTAGYYYIQTQRGSTVPEAESESNLGEANSTDNVQASTENKVTSDSASNSAPSTESIDKALTPESAAVKCEGSALCVTGEVVKVINGKTFYVNIQNKIYEVELALIGLPMQSEEAMRTATTFTRNMCLGSNVLIDQDDGQRENSFIAQVYCSPTKNLNSMLLNTGYVILDKSQCQTSEFSKLDWAKSGGC